MRNSDISAYNPYKKGFKCSTYIMHLHKNDTLDVQTYISEHTHKNTCLSLVSYNSQHTDTLYIFIKMISLICNYTYKHADMKTTLLIYQ